MSNSNSTPHDVDDELRWEPAGKISDWSEDSARVIAVGARRIAVYRHQGQFYALKDKCPHAGLPISDGSIADGMVTCPYHGWQFRLADGQGDAANVASYPVRETATGMIEVGV